MTQDILTLLRVDQELFQLSSNVGKLDFMTLEDSDQLLQSRLSVSFKEFELIPVAEHLSHLVPVRVSPFSFQACSPLVTSTNRQVKLPCRLLHPQGV